MKRVVSGSKRIAYVKLYGLAGAFVIAGILWPLIKPGVAFGQTIELKFEHFMPAASKQHADVIVPWARQIEAASNGRLRFNIAPGMGFGHKPFEFLDKTAQGEVDLVWTMAGYTPGRYPKLGVFELPWVVSSRAAVTSMAMQEYYEIFARDEFSDVRVLGVWCHSGGVIMSKERELVLPADLRGMKIRAGSPQLAQMVQAFGAEPVHLPAPAAAGGISSGALDGTIFPYEVFPVFGLQRGIHRVSEFAGDRALYTAVMVLAMNKQAYDRLSPDLQKLLDDHSGMRLAAEFGQGLDDLESLGRDAYTESGGSITFIKGKQYEMWYHLSQPVIDQWVAGQDQRGSDGKALLQAAKGLISKYSAQWSPDRG
jgi:TRAP-type transport system periplasmic protein